MASSKKPTYFAVRKLRKNVFAHFGIY